MRKLALVFLLSVAFAHAKEIPFHATSVGSSFAVAGDITGTLGVGSDKVTVTIARGHLVRQTNGRIKDRIITALYAEVAGWTDDRRTFQPLARSAPYQLNRSLAVGEAIPLDGVRFEVPVNEHTSDQIKNSWLVFAIGERGTAPDGKTGGGVSYVHASTSLTGAPTGFPSKRETKASGDLKVLENALSPLFASLNPKPLVSYLPEENSVQADYRTKSYKVQKATPGGESAQGAKFENGPDEQGFKFTAHLQNAGTVNQPAAPATIEHPNWKTEIGQTLVAGTQKQVYWSLSYGAQTDSALLNNIRASLQNLAANSN